MLESEAPQLPAIIEKPADQLEETKNDHTKKLEEFINALNENAASGSVVKDLAKLLMETLAAEYPKYDKLGDLVAMIPDHATRVKGAELLMKALKILTSEPGATFTGPVLIKWQD